MSHTYAYHIGTYQYSCNSMKNLLLNSRVTISYVYMSYHFISLFQSSQNFSMNILCLSLVQRKIDNASLISSFLPLFCMDIRALLLRSAAPPSGGTPPPASGGGRGIGLCSGYIITDVDVSMCQCVNMYTNQMSMSLDYPGQDPLPN